MMPSFGRFHVWMMPSLSFFPSRVWIAFLFPCNLCQADLQVLPLSPIMFPRNVSKHSITACILACTPQFPSRTSLLKFSVLLLLSGLVFSRSVHPGSPGLLIPDPLDWIHCVFLFQFIGFSSCVTALHPLKISKKWCMENKLYIRCL